MAIIAREPAAAAKRNYDLIILGGGIYGAMLSLEASRRGLRSLLIERDDFGEATSFNSLRIIHGGFRYLQSLDLHRFRESVRERRWFLRTFPDLVRPLPCLMPLYGNGVRRPLLLRIALRANDFLSRGRNQGVPPNQHLPPGRVIDAFRTREIFPLVDMAGLQGGAVWYDAYMPDSQRLLIEILRWACVNGATALNYVKGHQLLKTTKNHVAGIMAVDQESGATYEYQAKFVVNAAGPWCRNLAASFDRDEPRLFKASIAWNVLLDKEPLSQYALAVGSRKPGGQIYFLVPWRGKLLAGTGHAPWPGSLERPLPSTDQIQEFLNDLNLAVPEIKASQDDIFHVFAGLLPATKVGSASLAVREVILDHARSGGPYGLYSISGVKYTTARLVAEKTLNKIFPEKKIANCNIKYPNRLRIFNPSEDAQYKPGIFDYNWRPTPRDSKWLDVLRSLIAQESVQHLDDLVFRRTTLWDNPARALDVAPQICFLFNWNDSRCREEMERLRKRWVSRKNLFGKEIPLNDINSDELNFKAKTAPKSVHSTRSNIREE